MDKIFAFVLMPFDQRFEDVYRLAIKAAAEENGIVAERVDEQIFHKEGILERIYAQIEAADIIIADMSGTNPNVFYEVGYAHAKQKTCILLTEKAEDIPFDLRQRRHIVYGSSINRLKGLLFQDLQALKQKEKERQTALTVEFGNTKYGDLEKHSGETWAYATGSVTIKFDIHAAAQASSEIEAVYLYTGSGWRFTQDDIECPSTKSDLPEFNQRHLLKSPVRKLAQGGWAPIKAKGKKWLFQGKPKDLKGTYKLAGRIGVRVSTAERNFDTVAILEVECSDDIPF